MKIQIWKPVVFYAFALAVAGCDSRSDGDPDAGSDADAGLDSVTGVDVLVMVESGLSSQSWQPQLAPELFRFINLVTLPLGGEAAIADDFRIAVATANMGYSFAGTSGDSFFPDYVGTECGGFGDDGAFRNSQGEFGSGMVEVDFADAGIPCAAGQETTGCPAAWSCAEQGGGAVCVPPAGVSCADSSDTGAAFGATSSASPSADIGFATACSALVGGGCGWKQQLRSIERALSREDQAAFVRDGALLVVLAFTDDVECSIENGPALFESPEWTDDSALGAFDACDAHPEDLYAVSHFYDAITALKGGREEASMFAALTGVPMGAACEGRGDAIATCLDEADMQLVDGGTTAPHYATVCESSGPNGGVFAYANRRFVELASAHFGARGYIASLCRNDWSGAFDDIAAMVRERMQALRE